MMTKSLVEIREDFEKSLGPATDMSKRDGEYFNGLTAAAWAGYWQCAIDNCLLDGETSAELMH